MLRSAGSHAIHTLGISYVDTGFNEKLEAAYSKAIDAGLWKNTYAISSSQEYFAEGVQSYFSVNQPAEKPTGSQKSIATHLDLLNYDPRLYELIGSYLTYDGKNESCHFNSFFASP